jgi:hypothetical protein
VTPRLSVGSSRRRANSRSTPQSATTATAIDARRRGARDVDRRQRARRFGGVREVRWVSVASRARPRVSSVG